MTLVSVLLPVHNGARYLEQAARSILDQTHRDLELIVLDDGSTDDSGRIAEGLGDARVRLITNERNRGLAATLNRGLGAAKGGLVARQDADDLSHRERIEKQVRFLESNPGIGLLGTQAWVIDQRGRCRDSLEHGCEHASVVWELLFDNAFIHSSVMLRRDLVLMEHGYDEAWPYNQDYDLWTRLARTTRLANLPERLVAWRMHEGSMTQGMTHEASFSNRRLLARGLHVMFGEASEDVIELVARAREGMDERDLPRFLRLLKSWVSLYEASVPPEALPDFRRTVARQYMNLGRRRRSLRRLRLALFAGRGVARELIQASLALIADRLRLMAGYNPLAPFTVARR